MTSAWGFRLPVCVRLDPWPRITLMLPVRLRRGGSPGSGSRAMDWLAWGCRPGSICLENSSPWFHETAWVAGWDPSNAAP